MRRRGGHHPRSRLPPELGKFLSGETFSLLIKGGSGSGKSILAISIMSALKTGGTNLYICTRASPKQLLKENPWISEALADKQRPDGQVDSGWETLVDARLDEPAIVFERITNVLMDKTAPTVILDSWEVLNDSLDSEALRTNIRVLQTWRERAGARFIFIGEDDSNTTIDSVVDGVVVLREQSYAGRRLREIFLSKLHGVRISRPSYFFSLDGGSFRSFDRNRPSDLGVPAPGKESSESRHIGTGFKQLDEELGGGYPVKSVAWVEAEAQVDARAVAAFLSGTVRNWSTTGKSVLFERSEAFASALGHTGKSGDHVILWEMGRRKGKADGIAALRAEIARAKSPIVVADWDKITQFAVSTGPAEMESLLDLLKKAHLAILVSRSRPAGHPLSGIAATHIKIVEINGTTFVMSEKPWSEMYALVSEKEAGKTLLGLERVV